MKTVRCFGCAVSMDVPASAADKIQRCPEHQRGFAYCGGAMPYLCLTCRNDGKKLEQDMDGPHGFGGAPGWKVVHS